MPVLTLIVGYPGAGKTTIVRSMLDATFTGVTDGKIAWVQSKDAVVFGRWKGFHKDTKVAGRLDGTDRIHGSQFNKCKEALAGFVQQGVSHVIAEGFLLFRPAFLAEAERLGYQIRMLEVSTSSEESRRRLIARDGDGAKVKLHDKWVNMRIQWQEDPRWQTKTHGEYNT